jgi:hypothetical protein
MITTTNCPHETILGKSQNIFEDDTKNTYKIQMNELQDEYNQPEIDLSKKFSLLKQNFELNKKVNSIINCKKNEGEKIKTNNKEITDILNNLATEIEKYGNEKIQTNNQMNIANDRNKNIDIYYIVYTMFIVLLVIIQTTIVLFK